jgi:hypothetical protein
MGPNQAFADEITLPATSRHIASLRGQTDALIWRSPRVKPSSTLPKNRWCAKVESMMFPTAPAMISLHQPLTAVDGLPKNLSYN